MKQKVVVKGKNLYSKKGYKSKNQNGINEVQIRNKNDHLTREETKIKSFIVDVQLSPHSYIFLVFKKKTSSIYKQLYINSLNFNLA